MIIFNNLNSWIQAMCMKINDVNNSKLEYHFLLIIWLNLCMTLSLFIYDWTTYYKMHWIMFIIEIFFINLEVYFILVSFILWCYNAYQIKANLYQMFIQLYLIKLFSFKDVAFTLSINNVLQYMSNTFLSLIESSLYRALNYSWSNTLLNFLALLFALSSVLIYKYNEWLCMKKTVMLWVNLNIKREYWCVSVNHKIRSLRKLQIKNLVQSVLIANKVWINLFNTAR